MAFAIQLLWWIFPLVTEQCAGSGSPNFYIMLRHTMPSCESMMTVTSKVLRCGRHHHLQCQQWLSIGDWGMDSPDYTSGMFSFFSELKKTLSQAHYIKKTAPFPKTWVSPYSNVMLYNANFLRNHVAFSVVADMVQSSRCIWIGRWGDLPLWGATRNVLNFEISNLQHFSYIHGSHDNRLVTSPTHGSKLKSLWHMHIT